MTFEHFHPNFAQHGNSSDDIGMMWTHCVQSINVVSWKKEENILAKVGLLRQMEIFDI